MRRNNRRPFNNEERESKKLIMISLSVLLIAVLAFVITFIICTLKISSRISREEEKWRDKNRRL